MKKTYSLFLLAVMLFTTNVNAQFSIHRDPGVKDMMITTFPNGGPVATFICTSSGPGLHTFTGIDIALIQKKSSGTYSYNYTKYTFYSVRVEYVIWTGDTVVFSWPTVATGLPGGTQRINFTFPSPIRPLDSTLRVYIDAGFADGIDTAVNTLRCYGKVGGQIEGSSGTYISAGDSSQTTLFERPLTISPATAIDRTVNTLPTLSQIVGTFILTAKEDLVVTQLTLEANGHVFGFLPAFQNLMITDTALNDLLPIGAPINGSNVFVGGLYIHLAKNETKKIYVWSSWASAKYGDFIQSAVTDAYGQITPFAGFEMTPFRMDKPSLLSEKAVYKGPVEVPMVAMRETVLLYPNPVQDQFTIQGEGDWVATLTDMTGRVLANYSGTGSQVFSKGTIAPGQYSITVHGVHYYSVQKVLFN